LEQPTSERKAVRLRLILAALVVANVMLLLYQLFTPDTQANAGARIEELQINPGRIKLQRPLSEVGGVKRFAYFVREPDAGIVAQIAELQRGFTGTEIKAGPCPAT